MNFEQLFWNLDDDLILFKMKEGSATGFSALLHAGLDPGAAVSCPAETSIGGRTVHNAGATSLGGTSLREAFAPTPSARSCELASSTTLTVRIIGAPQRVIIM